jgi:hypothetical protein
MIGRTGAMRRRVRASVVAASMVTCAISLEAQTPGSGRDSTRVYRLRVQRGDTQFVRTLRVTRQQLEERLDSLQHEFEGKGLDAPDRVDLVRELRTILSSLGDLTDLEQGVRMRIVAPELSAAREKRQLVGRSELFAPLRGSMLSLQPGWIGINAEAPHQIVVRNDSAYIRYFGYPEIVSVEPNSPAERVGISRGDQLVAYDGADVRDRQINLTKLLQPSRRITITVRRDGEEREFPVIVGRPPARVVQRLELTAPGILMDALPRGVMTLRNAPRLPSIVFNGMDPASAPVAGATLAEIRNEELGHVFGVSRGVLVVEVFSDPARQSGLRGGDVIIHADGQDLTRIGQLRRIVAAHNSDRTVELDIVREKRARTITLRW